MLHEISFHSFNDRDEVQGWVYVPACKPKGIVQILCFFYYPSDEYLTYLMTVDEMMFTDEIDCSDLFGGNSERERIMIFEIGQ